MELHAILWYTEIELSKQDPNTNLIKYKLFCPSTKFNVLIGEKVNSAKIDQYEQLQYSITKSFITKNISRKRIRKNWPPIC